MGTTLAVCMSDNRGMVKEPVAEGVIEAGFGTAGDAQAQTESSARCLS